MAKVSNITLLLLLLCFLVTELRSQSIDSGVSDYFSIETIGPNIGQVAQIAFAPGDDSHIYIATFGNGIWRYDYSVSGGLTNGLQCVPTSISNQFGTNGSLGLAFHDDPTLGVLMYIAPAVPFTGDLGQTTIHPQSLIRLDDANSNGVWGEAGEINQPIVSNLEVTGLHSINQLYVFENTLYVNIGSRTSAGGDDASFANPGETAYSGAVCFIEDLLALSGDSTSSNTAGFNIANHKTDTQMFTSTDQGKLRVFCTGLRNNYGLGVNASGQLWVSMNQGGATANTPDEMHIATHKEDHGFFKKNDVEGDWKSNGDAVAAGFFATTTPNENPPDALLNTHGAAGGVAFAPDSANFGDQAFVTQYVSNNLSAVNANGTVTLVASGVNNALDVACDPFGNLIVGGNTGIYRINVLDDDPPKDGVVEYVETIADTGGDFTGVSLDLDIAGTLFWDYSNGSSSTGGSADRELGDVVGNQRNNLPPSVTFGSGSELEGASGGWGYQEIIDDFGGPFESGALASNIPQGNAELVTLTVNEDVASMTIGIMTDNLDGVAFVGSNLTVTLNGDSDSVDPTATMGTGLDSDLHLFNLTDLSSSDEISISTNAGTSGIGTISGVVVADVILSIVKGDVNQDGVVNLLDVQPFVVAVSGGKFVPEADVNCDGTVDLLDVGPFVALLAGN